MGKKIIKPENFGVWSEFALEGLNTMNESLKDIFEEDYDSIRYKHSGNMYEGYVNKVYDDYIEARVCLIDDINQKISKFSTVILYKQVFKSIELEWWYEGQGSCTRGSGSWELLEVA